MSDAEAQRDRSRWRSRAIVATAAFCAAIGIVSLARQATRRTVETGFDIVDASGGIEVRRGGAAESAGLRSGDRLLEIDGAPVDDVFSWNARLVSRTDERPLTIEVVRGESVLTLDLPVRVRRGGDPLYYYLALVGFFFLATATIAVLRTGPGRASTRYFAFSVAVFSVLAVSDSPAGTTLDLWLFIVDRLGRLTFPSLFVILCAALAESGPARRGALALLWMPRPCSARRT